MHAIKICSFPKKNVKLHFDIYMQFINNKRIYQLNEYQKEKINSLYTTEIVNIQYENMVDHNDYFFVLVLQNHSSK